MVRAAETRRAVKAALDVATSLGLEADDAVMLQNANKLALRLLPADVMARVSPVDEQDAAMEVELARRLGAAGCPVAVLDPRVEPGVYERDGFVVTLWTYYAPVQETKPAEYARALHRLHEGMRGIDMAVPRFTDRAGQALQLVTDPGRTPDLPGPDREFLAETLTAAVRSITGRGAPEQVLHGEPHPGNVLGTADGPRFVDFETCCRGPVEFDLAHAPEEVGAFYPGTDHELLRDCRVLMLAMVTAWRWNRHDQFPGGHELRTEWLGYVREAVA